MPLKKEKPLDAYPILLHTALEELLRERQALLLAEGSWSFCSNAREKWRVFLRVASKAGRYARALEATRIRGRLQEASPGAWQFTIESCDPMPSLAPLENILQRTSN